MASAQKEYERDKMRRQIYGNLGRADELHEKGRAFLAEGQELQRRLADAKARRDKAAYRLRQARQAKLMTDALALGHRSALTASTNWYLTAKPDVLKIDLKHRAFLAAAFVAQAPALAEEVSRKRRDASRWLKYVPGQVGGSAWFATELFWVARNWANFLMRAKPDADIKGALKFFEDPKKIARPPDTIGGGLDPASLGMTTEELHQRVALINESERMIAPKMGFKGGAR